MWAFTLHKCKEGNSVKATVENPIDSVEKLFPKKSVEGAHTAPQVSTASVGNWGTPLRGQFSSCDVPVYVVLSVQLFYGACRAFKL